MLRTNLIRNPMIIYITSTKNQIILQTSSKQLPNSIEERLSRNSSDEKIFKKKPKKQYEDALRKCEYDISLQFKTPQERKSNSTRRKRNIIWFNPPYSRNVTTNVANKFLRLIDKHFPKGSKLHKIFNKNTLKVSYSCTENLSRIIKGHNKRITSEKQEPNPDCNCRIKEKSPVQGKCRTNNAIYKCLIQAPDKT